VLEHHADAQASRACGVGDDDVPSFPPDRPVIGLHRAVDDLHERRLARAVLAEHRMNLAGHHCEVDVLVGDDARVALGDAVEDEAGSHRAKVGVRVAID